MSKIKEEKKEVVIELKEKFAKTSFVAVTDYKGISVAELTDLRKRLSQVNAEYKVAKNTLVKIAIKDTSYAELEKSFEGSTAILFSYGEASESAKTLVDFIKEIEKGDVKSGILDGKVLTENDIKTFAQLPPKPVILGQIAGLLVANTAAVAGAFESLIRDVALLIEEVAKKGTTQHA